MRWTSRCTVLEHLAAHPEGAALSDIAAAIGMPLSAAHRLLAELTKSGCVRQLRHQGDCGLTITEVFAPGMAAVAAPVVASGTTLGVVTIAGPAVRPDEARMKALGGSLVGTAREVAGPSKASSLFKRYVAATTARAGQASSR